jgi:lipopolysaccharide transport system ATP-binding protein
MNIAVSEATIRARNLTKVFELGGQSGGSVLNALMGRSSKPGFMALKSVSFEVGRGEVVGVIGPNGAGKSTLLKLIAKTLLPTSGEVEVRGRVAALLELGAGFHPERTGRENLYVGGLCMGYSRREIDARADEIIDFAEVGGFIDQPLKTFSTGMVARLAFSLATAVDPDILIVDETLSVGDARFERKSFARFEDFRAAGKTILVVSHYGGVIETICDRALYLDQGRLMMQGPTKAVVAQYMRDAFGPEDSAVPAAEPLPVDGAVSKRYGDGQAEIVDCGLFDDQGRRLDRVTSGQRCRLSARVRCNAERLDGLHVGLSITTKTGVRLVAVNPDLSGAEPISFRRGEIAEVDCELSMNLGLGDYFVTIGAWSRGAAAHHDRRTDVLHFQVGGPQVLRDSIVNAEPRYRTTVSQPV